MARKPTGKQPATGKKPAAKPATRKAKTKEKPAEEQKRRAPLSTAEWRKIRIEYVKGKTTYQKLAEKYGIKADTIRHRASKEGWRKKKHNLDTKVTQKVLERVCDARAQEFEKLAEVTEQVGSALDKVLKFIEDQPPRKYDDLRGVESLTKAIAQLVEIKRDLYNMPNEVDRAKIETLRDKAKLEREKYAEELAEKAASKAATANTVIKVVIEGTDEEMALDE